MTNKTSKLITPEDVIAQANNIVDDYELFDETPDSDSLSYELNPGLAEWEIEEAMKLQQFAKGIMIVTGMPGAGKDLFANMFIWKLNHYFANRHILRDEKPRKLAGLYTPFNEMVLAQELNKMKDLASFASKANKKEKAKLQIEADNEGKEFVEKNEVKFKGGIMYLTEFSRYMHNRDPFNRMGIAIGRLIKVWRHLDLLIVGTTQQKHELDKYSCIPFVTHDARCAWHVEPEPHTRTVIYRVQSVGEKGVLACTKHKPFRMRTFLNKEQPQLNGKAWKDLYVTKSITSIVSREVNL